MATKPYQPLLTTSAGGSVELRQTVLYHIRFALHILENMLFLYLQTKNDKARIRRRRLMAEAETEYLDSLDANQLSRYEELSENKSLVKSRNHPLFDFSTRHSTEILNRLDDSEKVKFFNFLKEEIRFADLHKYDDYISIIILLRKYRHFLEHYLPKNKPKENETEFFHTLGRILLPYFTGLLIGDLKKRGWRHISCDAIDYLNRGKESRDEARRRYSSHTRTKGEMDRGKRQQLYKADENFRKLYLEWFPENQRLSAYNLSNFRDHYFAIDRDHLRRFREENKVRSFHELELLFKLHHDMGLKLSFSVNHLHDKWLNGKTSSKSFAQILSKTDFAKNNPEQKKTLKAIRNSIAHGDLVLMQHDPQLVFNTIFNCLTHEGEIEYRNMLYDHLKMMLKRSRRIGVWKQVEIETKKGIEHHWRKTSEKTHWKPEDQQALTKLRQDTMPERFKLDRYRNIRNQAAKWMKALNAAFEDVKAKQTANNENKASNDT